MLWLCLHLPDLSLEVFTRGRDEDGAPLAVWHGRGSTQHILIVDAAAARLGLTPGMTLAAAHAVAGALLALQRDESLERAALEGVAAWAGRFTPLISLAPPRSLLLEVGSSLTLFGGLRTLRREVDNGARAQGHRPLLACAPTPLAAMLLARSGRGSDVTSTAALPGALADLPLSCLDLPPERLERLARMGVRRFGECLRLPRAGLARRLGGGLVADLDRALGRRPDPRRPYQPPPRFRAALPLPVEVEDTGALLFGANRLLQGLTGYLTARGAGVLGLVLRLNHHRRAATRVRLGLAAPSRDADHLMLLLRERLAAVTLPATVTELVLQSDGMAPLAPQSQALFPGGEASVARDHTLLERLRARLGSDAVRGLRALPEHRPERAWSYTAGAQPVPAVALPPRRRPSWLLAAPRPLAVQNGCPCLNGPLALETGPERIESGWWDGGDAARDYFVARDASGARFWIFQDLRAPGRWFLHGIFA